MVIGKHVNLNVNSLIYMISGVYTLNCHSSNTGSNCFSYNFCMQILSQFGIIIVSKYWSVFIGIAHFKCWTHCKVPTLGHFCTPTD